MPKSETTPRGGKVKKPSHFPSKPYMRALRAQSPSSVPAAAWSTTDDELLLRTKSSGKKWVEISPLFPGKTSNACRKRHARLVTHAEVQWDEHKERDLAVEFVNAKVGFFKMIAGNLKLEWRQVEKKCLELGFKTLLEKGKKVPIPFPPVNFQQVSTRGVVSEGIVRRSSSTPPQINSGSLPPPPSPSKPPENKAVVHPEPSDSDDAPPSRHPRNRMKSRISKGEPTIEQGEDSEEISRDGGDELDDEEDIPRILMK